MKNINIKTWQGLYTKIASILNSKHMFIAVLVIVALQGSWYALSFQPAINDEPKHFERIKIHAEQADPFLGEQKIEWDQAGPISRDGSFMSYYAMSWPYKFIKVFTANEMTQIIFLRFINLTLFIVGLVIMRKALLYIKGFTPGKVHLGFLFFVLTPTASLLAGAINYDNLVLPVFSLLLLFCIQFINTLDKSKTVRADLLLLIVIISLLLSVLKWTSIAFVIPAVGYLGWVLIRTYGKKTIKKTIGGLKSLSRVRALLLAGALILVTIPFIERPVMNMVSYGNPSPDCDLIISNERCRAYYDYRIYNDIEINKNPSFKPVNPFEYVMIYWTPKMITTMTNLLERGASTQLPVSVALYFFIFFVSLALLLIAFKQIVKSRARVFLVVLALGYITILILTEYGIYKHYGFPGAIRARYLVPILPFIFILTIYAASITFSKHKSLLLAAPLAILLLLSQGGGIVTWLLTTPDSTYWNQQTLQINQELKKVVTPLVKE